MIPLVSFDDVMAYMAMESPEALLAERGQIAIDTLQELGNQHILLQQERQQARGEIVERVLEQHEKEDHLLAANNLMPAVDQALQGTQEGIERLETANAIAKRYLEQLQETNRRLVAQLQEAKRAVKQDKPPLGRNQESIHQAFNSFSKYMSK